ncbi:putative 2,3-diketo-5-methylthio-1-phosphopentane phosphatase [Aspergillus tanneri]|uniref:2,3-diketo-5-methylthio-1-phosphopentane phosphatase n=1 Tax=Aspergillus tanneri TaxID=1220188 RepID=A0A5M9N3W9_9EURO|nr:uncharacterized protein ATNIH1004_005168 [Aspergillus tanneri]KAA8649267.1 hypothetical protein ATNIH1004_005168 [Aspergillus tanneri]
MYGMRKIVRFSGYRHVLVDNLGCGVEARKKLDEQIKSGERSFCEVSEDMWGSLRISLDDGFEVLKQLDMDSGFQEFHQFSCLTQSSRHIFGSGGVVKFEIVANCVAISPGGPNWKPIWRHESDLGHDKALSVNERRAQEVEDCPEGEIPLIIFIGDGVSDLPAAREADVLFARKGLLLEEYCIGNKIPYV